MKIDGMDAANFTTVATTKSPDSQILKKTQEDKPASKDDVNSSAQAVGLVDGRNISQLSEYDINELPISDKVVIEAIQKANRAISGANRRFEFSIHQKTKEIMIKVIDSDTNEVIREIPPEKILDMVAKMWEMAGIIVDERR